MKIDGDKYLELLKTVTQGFLSNPNLVGKNNVQFNTPGNNNTKDDVYKLDVRDDVVEMSERINEIARTILEVRSQATNDKEGMIAMETRKKIAVRLGKTFI
jgi:D-serine dehydratase